MALPEDFIKETSKLPGLDAASFAEAMSQAPETSVKINRRKASSAEELGYGELEPVKWCDSGFYLKERPLFTLNPLLHAGVFYVQDASSMIHETLVKALVQKGLVPEDALVLDACAAPGGKTTSVINALGDDATVVANEFVPQRAAVLRENLLKWGFPNIMATCGGVEKFAAAGENFDLVVVDAPCSGEGMMRKEPKAVEQWNPGLVRQCASLQREILGNAVSALKPGGILLYSTCTFNRAENEDQAAWLCSEFGLEPVDAELPAEWGIGASVEPWLPGLRFMPHLTRGEGLFAVVLRKPGNAGTTNRSKALDAVRKRAKVILDGIPRTAAKGKVELPASESVLATDYERGRFPEAELDRETALRYLRHEAITLGGGVPKGFVAVCHQDHPLGLVKNLGNRANNMYPQAWRIRMNIE